MNREMKHRVQFISLEEDENDLIVSFALDDPDLKNKGSELLMVPVS